MRKFLLLGLSALLSVSGVQAQKPVSIPNLTHEPARGRTYFVFNRDTFLLAVTKLVPAPQPTPKPVELDGLYVGTKNGSALVLRRIQGRLIVTQTRSETSYFPRGDNFLNGATLTQAFDRSKLQGGPTGWWGMEPPAGLEPPTGYERGVTADGAVFFFVGSEPSPDGTKPQPTPDVHPIPGPLPKPDGPQPQPDSTIKPVPQPDRVLDSAHVKPAYEVLRSTATHLKLIQVPAYEVGGYGPDYDPVKRHGEFTVADWTPCVLDPGTGFYGNVWDRRTDYRKLGFSHSTYRSAWSGTEYKGEQFWNRAPWEAKACLAYLDGPFFGAGKTPRYHLDPKGGFQNFFYGLSQWDDMKARIDRDYTQELTDHSLFAYDYEASDYMPDNLGNARTTFEGGRYRQDLTSTAGKDGTVIDRLKRMGDGEFWMELTNAGARYWGQFDTYLRSKMRPGSLFFQYSNGNGGILGGGRPSGYGGREHEVQTTNGGTGISLWWYTWTQKWGHSEQKDFTSSVDQYYHQTTARGSRALTDLMWTYEVQHRASLTEAKLRGAAPKPALVFIAPFMERNPRQGWRQEHEPATKQVARGMALMPWFYKGGGWTWGTEAHPQWGKEVTGLSGVEAKGEGVDHYIAGRKMLVELAPFRAAGTEVVCVELSFDGKKTWVGNSGDFLEGTRAKNPGKYNAYFVHDRTRDGANAGAGWPVVLGLRAADGSIALATSRVHGPEEGQISFAARIKRPDGTYWESDVTLLDREWLVGYDRR